MTLDKILLAIAIEELDLITLGGKKVTRSFASKHYNVYQLQNIDGSNV